MTQGRTIPAPPSRLLLLAPMRIELEPVAKALGLQPSGQQFRGQVGGREVLAAACGVGASAAVEALTRLLMSYPCGRAVLLGFAGALDPALPVGAVPAFKWVTDGQGHAARLTGGVPEITGDDERPPGEPALLTVGQLIATPGGKRELRERTHAAAVDMEALGVAQFAAAHGLRLDVVRAISDSADHSLPPESAGWVRADGSADAGAALRWLVRQPWRLPTLLRLQRDTKAAGRALADAIAQRLRRQTEA